MLRQEAEENGLSLQHQVLAVLDKHTAASRLKGLFKNTAGLDASVWCDAPLPGVRREPARAALEPWDTLIAPSICGSR